MAVNYAYTDIQGRKITQTAYNAQKNAGTDVSGYKPISIAPIVQEQPADQAPVSSTTDTSVKLPFSKESATYKALTARWDTDQMIVDAYNKAQSARTPEQQARTKALETPAAPVNDNIQQPKEETPAKPVEPKKEVVKTPAQLQAEADAIRYSDNSEARLAEIANNLNNAVATNPNSLRTLDAFKSAYSYNLRSKEQQQVLNDWYSGYQKSIKLWLTPVNDIMIGYDNGTITSTDLETLKATNPTKYAEVQTAIENKKELKKFQDELYGVKESTIWVADTTANVDDPNLFDEYKAAINSDEAKALNTSIADQDWKISQLKLKLLDIEKDVEKRYEGTGATKGKIAYIVAKEQAEIQKQISELSIDMNTSINKYNSIVNTAKDIMTLGLQEKTAEQQERQAKMQELWFFYQYTPSGMAQMATAKYNAENPDLDSTNVGTSTMALNQTLDAYYKDYGDIIQRPKAQVVADVIKLAKSKGISVSQALKENFITPLQNKPQYKSKIAKEYGMNTAQSAVNNALASVWVIAWSWNIVLANLWGSNQYLDSVAAPSAESAFTQMRAAWIKTIVGKTLRSKDEQAKLVKEWKSWTMNSKHLTGMAMDIYSGKDDKGKLIKPSDAQIKIMNANWRYQPAETMAKWDYWHFEYRWGGTTWATGIGTISTDATNIINNYAKITDYPIWDRARVAAEVWAYFESIKSTVSPEEYKIMTSSLYTDIPNEWPRNKLSSIANVSYQLDNLVSTLNSTDTWPLRELWEKKADKWTNQDTQALRQQMEAILPDLARGVFGEKWVLTDTDIERYRKTIPNIWNKQEVNKKIVQNLKDILWNTFKTTLVEEANNKTNVANWLDDYRKFFWISSSWTQPSWTQPSWSNTNRWDHIQWTPVTPYIIKDMP
jgi:hypothetical protein